MPSRLNAGQDEKQDGHGSRMRAVVVDHSAQRQKEIEKADSKQRPRGAGGTGGYGSDAIFDYDKAVEPPLPLDDLWTLFEECAPHSSAIKAKAADAFGRGWKLVPEDDTETAEGDQPAESKQQVTDADQLERKIRDQLAVLCSKLGWSQLVAQTGKEYEAMGWGVWEITRETPGDFTSPIDGIYPMPGQTVRATKDDDVFVQGRAEKKVYFKRFGAECNVDAKDGHKDVADDGEEAKPVEEDNIANEVLVFKSYTPRSDYYGIPDWISGVPAIAELTAIREYNISWFESGGQVDRLIHVSDKDEGDAKELADSIKQQAEEVRGQGHRTIISYGDEDSKVTVEPLAPELATAGARDRSFRQGREDLIREVLIAHEVPPYRVGWAELGSLGGSAAKEMSDNYRYGVVEPLQESFEEILNATVFNPKVGGVDISGFRFEFVDIDWDQFELDLETATNGVKTGILSPNDARERLGEDRVDDPALDMHYSFGFQPYPLDTDNGDTASTVGLLQQLRDALQANVKQPAKPDGQQQEPPPENQPEEPAQKSRRWTSVFRRDG